MRDKNGDRNEGKDEFICHSRYSQSKVVGRSDSFFRDDDGTRGRGSIDAIILVVRGGGSTVGSM
jgi:hypothetical protein